MLANFSDFKLFVNIKLRQRSRQTVKGQLNDRYKDNKLAGETLYRMLMFFIYKNVNVSIR